jgi:hypothetical protein
LDPLFSQIQSRFYANLSPSIQPFFLKCTVANADIDIGKVGREVEVGEYKFGGQQDSRGCFKKSGGQLWTVDATEAELRAEVGKLIKWGEAPIKVKFNCQKAW